MGRSDRRPVTFPTAHPEPLAKRVLLILVAVPVLGVLFGGIYALPVTRLTRGKEPYTTALLALCLAAPVVLIGHAFGTSHAWMVINGLLALVGLAIQRARGPLDGNLERFGMAHACAMAVALGIGMLSRAVATPH